ncbi:MAG: redoxin domain-containing protein [Chloroflexota bacterium]
MENYVKDLQPELPVNYCKLVIVTVDPPDVTRGLRDRIGATFPFLIDQERKLINELDIVDNTDPKHSPIPIPYSFTLDRDRTIHKVYNGWWYVGRPTVEEIRIDYRAMLSKRSDYAYDRAWDEKEGD